jgi:hypothetical protein
MTTITKEFALQNSLYFKPANKMEVNEIVKKFSSWGYNWSVDAKDFISRSQKLNYKTTQDDLILACGISLTAGLVTFGKAAGALSCDIRHLNEDYVAPKTDSEKLTDIYNLIAKQSEQIAALTKIVEDSQKQTAPEKTLGPGHKGPRYNGGC